MDGDERVLVCEGVRGDVGEVGEVDRFELDRSR